MRSIPQWKSESARPGCLTGICITIFLYGCPVRTTIANNNLYIVKKKHKASVQRIFALKRISVASHFDALWSAEAYLHWPALLEFPHNEDWAKPGSQPGRGQGFQPEHITYALANIGTNKRCEGEHEFSPASTTANWFRHT